MDEYKFRIGYGFDVHRLVEGREFWLGGVKIDHPVGCLGHSDADVLIHAICDAILGALALGDIGRHYPDTSQQWKGVDSKLLLHDVCLKMSGMGYRVGNADATICLQKPKIMPYVDRMRAVLASIMEVEISDISIKATTNEGMGFVGREEGITAHAVVLLIKK